MNNRRVKQIALIEVVSMHFVCFGTSPVHLNSCFFFFFTLLGCLNNGENPGMNVRKRAFERDIDFREFRLSSYFFFLFFFKQCTQIITFLERQSTNLQIILSSVM